MSLHRHRVEPSNAELRRSKPRRRALFSVQLPPRSRASTAAHNERRSVKTGLRPTEECSDVVAGDAAYQAVGQWDRLKCPRRDWAKVMSMDLRELLPCPDTRQACWVGFRRQLRKVHSEWPRSDQRNAHQFLCWHYGQFKYARKQLQFGAIHIMKRMECYECRFGFGPVF